MKSIILRTTFIVLSLSLIVTLFYNFSIPNREVILTIPHGSNGKTITELLYENRLISNKKIFILFSGFTRSTKKFQSGTYKLNQKMDMFKIMDILKKGKVYSIKFTVPEGYTSVQIAELLEQKNLGNKKEFLKIAEKEKLEGYLYPETYFIPYGSAEKEIAAFMVNEFKKNYTPQLAEQAKKLKMSTQAVITLASIIEREAVSSEERALISGIFYNRLKKGWMLESCATIRYALNKYTDKITYKDLRINSPYNTYEHHGLPPGPICNPGMPSIQAALNPANTDLMFFFSNGKGTHEFSKYYKQHLEKQKKHL
ncbi:MAG: endolytic transglycosylase MltG [Elusimicrobia bacterium]|nr:endolytic transglycosylase MltG [Elusimicrobiota bacterium]MBU2614709.1 endolytic transglycosylase MltG [Elusimicrobiota bacterium]